MQSAELNNLKISAIDWLPLMSMINALFLSTINTFNRD